MSIKTDYIATGRLVGRYIPIGNPVWAAKMDQSVEQMISSVDTGTAANKTQKATIVRDWASNLVTELNKII